MRLRLLLGSDISPFIALIDDDDHSAHLLQRMLADCGAVNAVHLGGAETGLAALKTILDDNAATWPALLIVDLKSHSDAVLEFVAPIHDWLRHKGVELAVMIPPTDRSGRNRYLEAGVDAVFFRQPERDAYRREAEGIISFQARSRRLDAVGM